MKHQKTRLLATLYHYTCDHGYAGISASGVLRPNVHPFMPHLGPLLWLTDREAPDAESVGLTSDWLTCDRLQYRYVVHTRAAIPWAEIRGRATRATVETLEAFGEPAHWWVVRRPLLASEFALDVTYQRREVSA